MVDPYLEDAPFEELCDDHVLVSAAPSIENIDSIYTKPLDLTPLQPLYFPRPSLICMHLRRA